MPPRSLALFIEDEIFARHEAQRLRKQGIVSKITPRAASSEELIKFYDSFSERDIVAMVLVLVDQGYFPGLAQPLIQEIRRLSPEALILERSGDPQPARLAETDAVIFDTLVFTSMLARLADTALNQ